MLYTRVLTTLLLTLSHPALAADLVALTAKEIKSIQKTFIRDKTLQDDLLPVIRQFGIEDQVATRSCGWIWRGLGQLVGSEIKTLGDLVPGLTLLQQDYLRTCVLEHKPESHFILKSLNPKIENGQLQIIDTPKDFSSITEHVKISPAELRAGLVGTRLSMPVALSVTHFHFSDQQFTHSYEYEFSIELQDGRIFDFKGKRIQSSYKEDFLRLLKNTVENVQLLLNPAMLESETMRLGQALKLLAIKHPKYRNDLELMYKTLDPLYFIKRKNNGTENFMRVILLETESEENTLMDFNIEKALDQVSIQDSDRELRSIYLNDIARPSDNPDAEDVFRFILAEWDGRLHYDDELSETRKYIRNVIDRNPGFYKALSMRRGGEVSTQSSSSSSGVSLLDIIVVSSIINSLSRSGGSQQ